MTNNLLINVASEFINRLFGRKQQAPKWNPSTNNGKLYWHPVPLELKQPEQPKPEQVRAYVNSGTKNTGLVQPGAIYTGTITNMGDLVIIKKGLRHTFKKGTFTITKN